MPQPETAQRADEVEYKDRIKRVQIKNVRAIEFMDLEVGHPLTVLIGENGTGKSTIVEC